MRSKKRITLAGVAIAAAISIAITGCAYLGFHGPSVRLHPDIHEDVATDKECLECHGPGEPVGPETPHPKFKNCLRCHNSAVTTKETALDPKVIKKTSPKK